MQTLCHCSQPATVSVQNILICPKCEDFLTRHPALEATLIEQWKNLRAAQKPEPNTDAN